MRVAVVVSAGAGRGLAPSIGRFLDDSAFGHDRLRPWQCTFRNRRAMCAPLFTADRATHAQGVLTKRIVTRSGGCSN